MILWDFNPDMASRTETRPAMTTLHTAEEFRRFVEERRIPLTAKHETIHVNLDTLDVDTNRRLETELNKLHAVCGCMEGSVTAVIGLGLYAVFLILPGAANIIPGNQAIIWAICTFFAFAIIGKFTAIYIAHRKLKLLVRNLDTYQCY